MKILLLALLLSISIPAMSWQDDRRNLEMAIEEMRLELSDVKHALHTYQVELNILDEKMKAQHQSVNSLKNQSKSPIVEQVEQKIGSLEKKLHLIENLQEKVSADLRLLNTSLAKTQEKIGQFEKDIAFQNSRLDEVVKLKSTLASISQAVAPKEPVEEAPSTPFKTYKVKGGDSLDKIARANHTTAAALKKLNRLDNDHIQVNQLLKLPLDER